MWIKEEYNNVYVYRKHRKHTQLIYEEEYNSYLFYIDNNNDILLEEDDYFTLPDYIKSKYI